MKLKNTYIQLLTTILSIMLVEYSLITNCFADNYTVHDFDGKSHLIDEVLQSKNGKHYVLELENGGFARYSLDSGVSDIPKGTIGDFSNIQEIANNGEILLMSECTVSVLNINNRKTKIFQIPECENTYQKTAATLNARGTVIVGYMVGEQYKFISVRNGAQRSLRTITLPTRQETDINFYLRSHVEVSDNGKALTFLYYYRKPDNYEEHQEGSSTYRHDLRRGRSTKLRGGGIAHQYYNAAMNSKNGSIYSLTWNKIYRVKRGRRLRRTATVHANDQFYSSSSFHADTITSGGRAFGNTEIYGLKDAVESLTFNEYLLATATDKRGRAYLTPCLLKNSERLSITQILDIAENDDVLVNAWHNDRDVSVRVILKPKKDKRHQNYCAFKHEVAVNIDGKDVSWSTAEDLLDADESELLSRKACYRTIRMMNTTGKPLAHKNVLLIYEEEIDDLEKLTHYEILQTDQNGELTVSRGSCKVTLEAHMRAPYGDSTYQYLGNYEDYFGV